MNFDFSAEQYMFQESVRAFLDKKFDLAKLRALAESDGSDAQLWNGLLELGAFSMLIPEAHGGLGLSLVDLALVLEEFGRALVPPPVAETIAATDVLVRHATDEQNARLLPRIAEGALKLVPAIAEAQAGKRFVLQGGDCAETLLDCQPAIIANKLKILLQMSMVLVHAGKRPVVRVGRLAGQYAKPRSKPTEERDGVVLPSYFGDLVNRPEFTPEARRANQALVDLLGAIAVRKKATPAQISLAWLLAQKPWIVPIPGTTNPERLDENIGGAAVVLTSADLRDIEGATAKIPVEGDRYPERLEKMTGL